MTDEFLDQLPQHERFPAAGTAGDRGGRTALRSTATTISGSSGSGKSFMLRQLIKELVRHRQGFSVVDPHGEVAQFALFALRRAGVRPDRIVYIDPSDLQYVPAVNPLMFATDPAEAASLACDCFARAWN